MARKTAPKGLGPKGRKLWRDITSEYDLRPDELSNLEDACREVDLIERLEMAVSAEEFEFEVKGSQGQPVASPVLQELRHHRNAKRQLLAAINLPDESEKGERSSAGRALVSARWHRGAA